MSSEKNSIFNGLKELWSQPSNRKPNKSPNRSPYGTPNKSPNRSLGGPEKRGQNNQNLKKNNSNRRNKTSRGTNNGKSLNFLLLLLQLQNQMKIYHWQTELHSRHISSDMFLKSFTDKFDKLIEAYQGRYGIVTVGDKKTSIKIDDLGDKEMKSFLTKTRKELLEMSSELFNKKEDGSLINLMDEIIESIDVTLYLFNQK